MKVKWRRGSRAKVPAEKAFEVLTGIHARDGKVTPPAVVDEARPEESVLHPEFEWQDDVAAEKFREAQAANLIRSLVVVTDKTTEDADEKPKQVRVFVRPVPPAETEHDPYKHLRAPGSYSLTDDVFSDPVLRHQFLARAWQELKAFRARYQALSEFASLFEAMDRVAASPEFGAVAGF